MARQDPWPPSQHPTLLPPPPDDPTKSPIELLNEIVPLTALGPDIFTNARPAWHPPGARGIFGGAVVAHCLAAAQATTPSPDLAPHSFHCYFLEAGRADAPIILHVERVRDGRSFATRTVQARQAGRCIFTTTVSFARPSPSSSGRDRRILQHPAPATLPAPPSSSSSSSSSASSPPSFPCEATPFQTIGGPTPAQRHCQAWMRACGPISAGRPAHLAALAYMSDAGFIGTVARVHAASAADLGMIVSLDHSVYFHAPDRVRADQWMLADMESPWAGSERGLALQRIYAADGTLLATCVQEGIVRLKADHGHDLPRL